MDGVADLFNEHILDYLGNEVDLRRKKQKKNQSAFRLCGVGCWPKTVTIDQSVDLNDNKNKRKVVGLLFSATFFSDGPCQTFKSILAEFYNKHREDKNFEIIFISADSNEKNFYESHEGMPWLTLDYNEQEKRDELRQKFKVKGFPRLVLLDGNTGNVICDDARDQIESDDKNGEHFPWKTTGKRND